jgi:hypothetical protein
VGGCPSSSPPPTCRSGARSWRRCASAAWRCAPSPSSARLGAVLEGAHTVVHLDRPAETADLLVDAADGTSVRRVVAVAADVLEPPPAYGALEVVVVPADPAGEPADPAAVAAVLAADARA